MIRSLSLLENTSSGNCNRNLTAKALLVSDRIKGLSILDLELRTTSMISPRAVSTMEQRGRLTG